ncbi:MAG: hypothetical protein DMG33_16680, partial [Acidobacteria bacterium]
MWTVSGLGGDMQRGLAMKPATRHQLDPSVRSPETQDFEGALRAKIVGQEEGTQALVDLYQVFCAGMNS